MSQEIQMKTRSFKMVMAILAPLAGIALTAAPASAAVIIDSSTQGYYNNSLGDLAAQGVGPLNQFIPANCNGGACWGANDPTINNAAEPTGLDGIANLGTWLTASAPTGGTWSLSPVAIPGAWTVNNEVAIVYAIDAGAYGISSLDIQLGVDNGVYVWLDGDYQFGALAGGGAFLGEYSLTLNDLGPGIHYLQLLLEDHGGSTGFSILADATYNTSGPNPSEVPVPASLGLLLIGLAAVGRRRQ